MSNLTPPHNRFPETLSTRLPRYVTLGLLGGSVLLLCLVYSATLLTHIAGSNDPFLEDGGEIQVALNVWGTLHGTSYPLFTILGNAAVSFAQLIGVDPATAPSLYALAWGIIALGLFYFLLRKLTGQPTLAAICTVLLALTRGVWAYNVLPKTYSMSLAFFVAILAVTLWPTDRVSARQRFWLLTVVGGFGVAHHRLIAFALPGTLLVILPLLWRESAKKNRWRWLIVAITAAIPLALIGFLPYLYLPVRALAHGVWVYGNPSTLPGFWREFTAQEANYLFALPANIAAWLVDSRDTLQIYIDQLSPLGALLVSILAIYGARRRHEARIALLCSLPVLLFVLIWHRAVVAQAVVMPVVMFAVFAAVLGLIDLVARFKIPIKVHHYADFACIAVAVLATLGLIGWSFSDLRTIVTANEGDQEIALAQTVPRANGSSVFMLPWGMRYSAVAFSHYVTHENADLSIVDHKADFSGLLASGHLLYTDKDTFYTFPLSWWDSQVQRTFLNGVSSAENAKDAQNVVQISNTPFTASAANTNAFTPIQVTDNLQITNLELRCTDQAVSLVLHWYAQTNPAQDYSVFVHLIGQSASNVLATADESAPVYGWYPISRWLAGEVVTDRYTLPRLAGGLAVQFGLYQQPTPGKFVNFGVTSIALNTVANCQAK